MGTNKADFEAPAPNLRTLRTDEEIRELWEERSAVREFDGGYPRHRAEHLAARDVRQMIEPQPLPSWLIEAVAETTSRIEHK